MDKRLKCKNIKLLAKYHKKNIWDLGLDEEVINLTLKTWSIEEILMKWKSSKLKTLALGHTPLRVWKDK